MGLLKAIMGGWKNGELLISATMENLVQSIFQFTQLVAKVSNIDILRRETVKSLFFENLADCILSNAKKYAVESNFTPTRDRQLIVDYRLTGDHSARPLFVFGINENTKASKTVISCLNFQKQHIPFRSLIIQRTSNLLRHSIGIRLQTRQISNSLRLKTLKRKDLGTLTVNLHHDWMGRKANRKFYNLPFSKMYDTLMKY